MRGLNLVLTIADDQRHSALGCCDDPTADAVHTPHLDALAARGCRFSRAHHAGSPHGAVCMPSRAMLHSGRGPFDLPADMMGARIPSPSCGEDERRPLGGRLREAGYRTHAVGKWHNGEASFARSFETGEAIFRGGMSPDAFNVPVADWDGQAFHPGIHFGVHGTDLFTAAAVRWLEDYAAGRHGDRPFFLYVAFTAPHDPRRTHRQWHRRYPDDAIDLPANFRGEHPFDNGELAVRDELLTALPRDADQTRHEIGDYYAMTEHLDHGLGRIHAALDALGLAENTLVAHTADHGLAVGQHGLLGKQNLYDHSTRVPLILAGPGIPAGQRRDQLCYQHDLFPTLLEAAGASSEPDAGCGRPPFRSLWPAIASPDATLHDYVGCYYGGAQRMVTDGRRKQIRYRVRGRSFVQNFDLHADPWERLSADGSPIATCDPAVCDEYFQDWLDTTGDPWAAATSA